MRARFRPLLIPLALVALVAAGCGDDDEPTVAGDDDAPSAEAASGGVEAYCEKILAIETVGEPDIDFESLSPEELSAAVQEFASEELLPMAKEVQEVAPEEIAEEIDVLVAAVDEVAGTGDFEAAFEAPEVVAAEETAHAYDLEHCGWGTADVTAADYAFAGVEDEYEAGPISFDMTNEGDEMHELALLRKKDDTTQSFDELLEMDQAEAEALVDFVGGIEPTPPGEDDYFVADLEPGEYLAVCFLPVGATPQAFEAVESGQGAPPEGPPHFLRGMKAEFTVE